MSTIINASTSGAGGTIITPDNTGVLEIQTAGTTAITIDASQNVELANPLSADQGGTGLTSPGPAGYVLESDGTGWVASPSSSLLPTPGDEGNVLTSDGTEWISSAPGLELPSPGSEGQVLQSDGTDWISGSIQDVLPAPSTAGKVLTSNGTTWSSQSLPSQLPSPSNNGYVLKSNGTAWVSAPPLSVLPAPSTAGNVLMSNGSTWISSNPYYIFPPGGWYIYTLNNHKIGRLYGSIVNNFEIRRMLDVGISLIGNIIYEFEAVFHLKSDHKGSNKQRGGQFSFGFGGDATINNISYQVKSADSDTGDNTIDDDLIIRTGAGGTATITTTDLQVVLDVLPTYQNRNYHVCLTIRGSVSINTSGTFIPIWKSQLTNGGFYKTRKGSYFRIRPIGPAGGDASVGDWA